MQINGTYLNGHITLDKPVKIDKPVRVIVTFNEENDPGKERLTINDFSFLKSRELLKKVSANLSDAVIEERRKAL